MGYGGGMSPATEGFSFLLIFGAFLSLCYFLYRRDKFSIMFISAPWLLATTVHGMFPKPFPVTPYELFMTVFSGLPICLILNTMFLASLQAFSTKDGSNAGTAKRRLRMVGFYSALLFLNYSYIFESLGLKDSDGSITHSIFTAFYFTVSTWTTVGYGDVTPHDSFSRFVAGIAALNGYAVLGIWIAVLIPLFTTGTDHKSTPKESSVDPPNTGAT